ncbi:MAG TPA: RnfH family protein [Methyloradius sp.]
MELKKLNPENHNKILVEVAYAGPGAQIIITIQLSPPCTAHNAIEASGILLKFPEIDLTINKIGIFGKLCKLGKILRHRDRIEIYRFLTADPKELRRQNVAKK